MGPSCSQIMVRHLAFRGTNIIYSLGKDWRCMLILHILVRNMITTPYLGGGVWGGLDIGEFPITGWGVGAGVGGEWVDCASAALASHYLQWEARAPSIFLAFASHYLQWEAQAASAFRILPQTLPPTISSGRLGLLPLDKPEKPERGA